MPKKPKGNETSRAEAITMRVSPKLRYGLELLCRKQHRNITSVMEWALERILSDEKDGLISQDHRKVNLQDLWAVDPIDRLLRLVTLWPSLMTYEEELLWSLISNGYHYWSHFYTGDSQYVYWDTEAPFSHLKRDLLKSDWEVLNAIALGDKSLSELPNYLAADSSEETRKYKREEDSNLIPF